ncbi:MAG: Na+/H+ antiporter NhaC family protein [Cardiobacteriaceae bacterium]|nr:Na+/H+ antiporter NhaC family protein [Cardiobacteriaceae bacterium]
MDLWLNPVVVAVVLMVVLSVCRVHVVLSLIIATLVGGWLSDIPAEVIREALSLEADNAVGWVDKTRYVIKVFEGGLGAGVVTALSYAVLGAFAVAISYSGLSRVLAHQLVRKVESEQNAPSQSAFSVKYWVIGALWVAAMLSQNVIPVHIAFIPILVPPLLSVANRLQLDRRLLACVLSFGLVCTYMFVPYGYGDMYLNKILKANIIKFGMDVKDTNIYLAMLIPALSMLLGLAVAIWVSYRKPRVYQDLPIEGASNDEVSISQKQLTFSLVAVAAAFVAQSVTGSLIFSGLVGFGVFMLAGIVEWDKSDAVFNSGIRMMSMIGFIMITANGFAAVMNASGAIEPLVKGSVALFGGSKALIVMAMLVVGLLVTMGIGSSFSTLPIVAAIYVPMCVELGFSPLATLAIIGTAGALGDAGSPASDSTLGPTMGLNADGQHDHVKDSVIPTFLHYNIPLLIGGWIAAMVL